MDEVNDKASEFSYIQIEDGFEYGNWRDQCVSDKLFGDYSYSEISLSKNQINIKFDELELNCDAKPAQMHESPINDENDSNTIRKSEILNDDSLNFSEDNNCKRAFEPDKDGDSENSVTVAKSKSSRINIHLRKDVVNKTIIRAFNRFYLKKFKLKQNCSNKTRDVLCNDLNQSVNRKIISLASYQEHFDNVDDDFKDLIVCIITWMTCSKSMKAKLKRYFGQIEEIRILDDVLTSYSHTKFDKMYKSKAIKTLFEVFIAENREELLSDFTSIQRDRYEQELRSISACFSRQQWEPLNFNERLPSDKI